MSEFHEKLEYWHNKGMRDYPHYDPPSSASDIPAKIIGSLIGMRGKTVRHEEAAYQKAYDRGYRHAERMGKHHHGKDPKAEAEKERRQKEWEARKSEREKKQKEWEERKREREKKQKEWEARKEERERKQREWEARKKERERKQKEWEARKAERERKQKEWEARKVERERKQKEWEARKSERERKQREWEARKAERERNQREWEARKAQRQREWESRQEERARRQREWESRQEERERRKREWEERQSNRRSGRRGGGGGCYITTATCTTLGKEDNCIELRIVRDFRDNWLIYQKNGLKIIDEYYKCAPEIVKSINDEKEFREIYKYIWDRFLFEFIGLILENKNRKALAIYSSMVDTLKKRHL